MGKTLITIRRLAIALVLVLAYGYYRMIGSTAALAQVGLISFAAVAQFAPAFFGALMWKRATARGAMAGLAAGALVWVYTLLLPVLRRCRLDWQRPDRAGAVRPGFSPAPDAVQHGNGCLEPRRAVEPCRKSLRLCRVFPEPPAHPY